MEICCFFSRPKSPKQVNFAKENYKNKSNEYLKNKLKKLDAKKSRESCYCCLYTTCSITGIVTTFVSKGTLSTITIPSIAVTTISANKSFDKLNQINQKKKIITDLLNERMGIFN